MSKTSVAPGIPFSQIAVGMAIRTCRLAAGRTVASILKATGLNVSVYSRIETGARGLEFSEAVMLANEMGVSLERIAGLAKTFESSGAAEISKAQRREACDQKIDRENSESLSEARQ